MQFSFQCPQCGGHLEADSSLTGVQAKCPSCGGAVAVPEGRVGPGATLAGFRLDSRLGKGGMGEVFLARQLSVDREVAVKVLPPNFAEDASAVKRFLQEGLLAAKLDHAHIATVYEAGEDSGNYYLAMAYVEGEALDARLKRDKMITEAEALDVVQAVAEALAYAWDEFRLLHRDIKPANIMLDRRKRIFLMDLGLAKSLGEESGLTLSGAILGTPHYMSPEQALGQSDLGLASDVYSLGATLYHLVTGAPPFADDTTLAILNRHVHDPLPPPRERNPQLSAGCCQLIERMMAKAPEDRYANWGELLADLAKARSGAVPEAAQPPAPRQSRPAVAATPLRSTGRKRLLAGAMACVVVLLIVGSLVARSRHKPAPSTTSSSGLSGSSQGSSALPSTMLAVDSAALRNAMARIGPPLFGKWYLSFDGSTTCVRVPDLAWLPNAPLTIEAVVWPNEGKSGFVAGRRGPKGMWIEIHNMKIAVCHQPEVGPSMVAEADFLPGRCVHVAGVWDRRQLRLYLNGCLAALGEQRGKVKPRELEEFSVGAADDDWLRGYVGAVRVSANARYTTSFDIDSVLPLRSDHYTLCLLAFEEGEGRFLGDSSPNGRHGQLLGKDVAGLWHRTWPCRVPEARLRRVQADFRQANPGAEQVLLRVGGRPGGVKVYVPSDPNVRDISSLRLLPLRELTMDRTGVTSLAPLAGKSLVSLSINETQITDLSPLSGTPLAFLAAWHTPLKTLEPIRGCPLQFLSVDGDGLASFPAFPSRRLRYLAIGHLPGDNLVPLADQPLVALSIREGEFSDFSPLRACPLRLVGVPRGHVPSQVSSQLPTNPEVVVLPTWTEHLSHYQAMVWEKYWLAEAEAEAEESDASPQAPVRPLGARIPRRRPLGAVRNRLAK